MSEVELYEWASVQDFRRKRNHSVRRAVLAVLAAAIIAFSALFAVQNLQALSNRLDAQLSMVPALVDQLHRGAEVAKQSVSAETVDAAKLTASQREELRRSGATHAVDCAALGEDWGAISRELGDSIVCGFHR